MSAIENEGVISYTPDDPDEEMRKLRKLLVSVKRRKNKGKYAAVAMENRSLDVACPSCGYEFNESVGFTFYYDTSKARWIPALNVWTCINDTECMERIALYQRILITCPRCGRRFIKECGTWAERDIDCGVIVFYDVFRKRATDRGKEVGAR